LGSGGLLVDTARKRPDATPLLHTGVERSGQRPASDEELLFFLTFFSNSFEMPAAPDRPCEGLSS
jgi:hypothetical protein